MRANHANDHDDSSPREWRPIMTRKIRVPDPVEEKRVLKTGIAFLTLKT